MLATKYDISKQAFNQSSEHEVDFLINVRRNENIHIKLF